MEARSLSIQQAMEQALGKLVMDGGFRDAFFRDPAEASEAAGIPLTDRERNALTRIPQGARAALQRYLDAKRLADWREEPSAQTPRSSDSTGRQRATPSLPNIAHRVESARRENNNEL